MGVLNSLGVRVFDGLADMFLAREQQIKVGYHLLCRGRGDGNGNPVTNGENRLLHEVKERFHGREAVFFDVGANVGDWAIAAVENMDDLHLYAFEPASRTFSSLLVALKKCRREDAITPIPAALSDSDGEGNLYIAGELAGTNSLHLRDAGALGLYQDEVERIVVMRGDTFCNDRGIDRVDFLKIDTEGNEMAVLEGFGHLVEQGRIGLIQFEYGGTWIDSRRFLADAFKLLGSGGYRIGKIHPTGIRYLEQYDPRDETFIYANYLAVRPDWVPLLYSI
jgi:FkbM family methyltransferase